jgi:hypothetical protein
MTLELPPVRFIPLEIVPFFKGCQQYVQTQTWFPLKAEIPVHSRYLITPPPGIGETLRIPPEHSNIVRDGTPGTKTFHMLDMASLPVLGVVRIGVEGVPRLVGKACRVFREDEASIGCGRHPQPRQDSPACSRISPLLRVPLNRYQQSRQSSNAEIWTYFARVLDSFMNCFRPHIGHVKK